MSSYEDKYIIYFRFPGSRGGLWAEIVDQKVGQKPTKFNIEKGRKCDVARVEITLLEYRVVYRDFSFIYIPRTRNNLKGASWFPCV